MTNKIFSIFILLLSVFTLPIQAQTADADSTSKSTTKKRLNTFWGSTKKGFKKTGQAIGGFFGIEGKDSDLVKIDGVEYMPLYTTNIFLGDGSEMLSTSSADALSRYPQATIVSVAIPQEAWLETTVTKKKKVTSYQRLAYCYVLLKDADEGYINVRYSYIMQRQAGQSWEKIAEYWPMMERADVIPNAHYSVLKDQ